MMKTGRPVKNRIGQKFGYLELIRLTDEKKKVGYKSYAVYECKCHACGNVVLKGIDDLRKKLSSCGCLSRGRGGQGEDISNRRIGRLTVVRPTSERIGTSVAWECLCDCGKTVLVSRNRLVSETRKSCGCLEKKKRE